MITTEQTDKLIQQLKSLTTEEIDFLIDLVGFLHHRKSIQQPIQPLIQSHSQVQSQSQVKQPPEPLAFPPSAPIG